MIDSVAVFISAAIEPPQFVVECAVERQDKLPVSRFARCGETNAAALALLLKVDRPLFRDSTNVRYLRGRNLEVRNIQKDLRSGLVHGHGDRDVSSKRLVV